MLQHNITQHGTLSATTYDFDDVGDELPRHTHDDQTVHVSIVARGAFKVFGDGWEQEYRAGAFLDWEPGVYHGFIALEPNSRLINIVKG